MGKNRRGKDIVSYDERILELQKEAPERRKTAGRVKIREPFFVPHSKGSVLYVVSNGGPVVNFLKSLNKHFCFLIYSFPDNFLLVSFRIMTFPDPKFY